MKIIDLKFDARKIEDNIKISLSAFLQKITPFSAIESKINTPNIKRLYFEVTNICNAKCVFCAYRKVNEGQEYKKGIMDFEVFKKGVDDYYEMGGRAISLTPTIGETLLDPGLFEKIEYAVHKKKMNKVYFYTNGILLGNNDNYKKLIDSGIHEVAISTTSFSRNIFEKVYGVPCYDQFLSGICNFLKYNKERGEAIKISFNFRIPEKPSQALNQPDYVNLIKPYLSSRVKYSILVDYDNWGGKIRQDDLVGTMSLRKKFTRQKFPCLRTFDAAILFDGSVRLCGCRIMDSEFDDLIVGNIMENKFSEIYYGEKANAIRHGYLNGKMPKICQNCSLYDPGDFVYKNYING